MYFLMMANEKSVNFSWYSAYPDVQVDRFPGILRSSIIIVFYLFEYSILPILV